MLREELCGGGPVIGMMISEFGCPNLIRIMKGAGFSFVIVDAEHGPFDMTALSQMISLGNGIGMPVLVRIPGIDRGMITKILDMGAEGFLVPMVNTPEDAEELVKYAKYAPLGRRGISTTRAHTNYHPPKLTDYMEFANKRTVLLTQIETKTAVRNADKIAAVPGVDALIVGPSDLSSDLGKPGVLSNQDLLDCAVAVTNAARTHGKFSGTVSSNKAYLEACKTMGMNLFSIGSELDMLIRGADYNRKLLG